MNWNAFLNAGRYVVELTKLWQARRISRATFIKNLVTRNQWVPEACGPGLILVMESYAVAEEMGWRRQQYERAQDRALDLSTGRVDY